MKRGYRHPGAQPYQQSAERCCGSGAPLTKAGITRSWNSIILQLKPNLSLHLAEQAITDVAHLRKIPLFLKHEKIPQKIGQLSPLENGESWPVDSPWGLLSSLFGRRKRTCRGLSVQHQLSETCEHFGVARNTLYGFPLGRVSFLGSQGHKPHHDEAYRRRNQGFHTFPTGISAKVVGGGNPDI